MNIQAEDIDDIVDDTTSFICFSYFKTFSEDVLDEVDGDPTWIVYTETYYTYCIYHRETDDTFFIILTITTVETDNRLHEIREDYIYYNYNYNDKSIDSHHRYDIKTKIEDYKKKKENTKLYFNNNVYYELMEKTLHPDRIKWFI